MKKRLFIGLTTIITILFFSISIELNLINESNNITITKNNSINKENEIERIDDVNNNTNSIENSIVDDTNINEENINNVIEENNNENIETIIAYENTEIIENNNTNSNQIQLNNYRQNEAFKVLSLINEIRKENGLNILTWNNSLEDSASTRAPEIVNTFEHTRPDGNDWYTAINTSYRTAGENIAAGQNTSIQVVQEWMESPGHRANILNPNFTEMGVALYYDSNDPYEYYWVQLFIGN